MYMSIADVYNGNTIVCLRHNDLRILPNRDTSQTKPIQDFRFQKTSSVNLVVSELCQHYQLVATLFYHWLISNYYFIHRLIILRCQNNYLMKKKKMSSVLTIIITIEIIIIRLLIYQTKIM